MIHGRTHHINFKKNLADSQYRDNEMVIRGVKAVTMIYQLSSRVPLLIQQSHLERNEG